MSEYEQYKQTGRVRKWVLVACTSLGILSWMMLIMVLVPDVPRQWNFGALPDTPAESIFSTQPPPANDNPPPQIEPLPEARATTRPGGSP